MGKEHLWRCSCGGGHFLSVTRDKEANLVYVNVDEYPEAGHWQRLVACWNLLRHRRHSWCELVLTPQQATEIATEITDAPREA